MARLFASESPSIKTMLETDACRAITMDMSARYNKHGDDDLESPQVFINEDRIEE